MDVEPKASSATTSSSSSTTSASSRYFVGTTTLAFRRDFMELQSPLTDGLGMLSPPARRVQWCDALMIAVVV
jgi:hypothetical protein